MSISFFNFKDLHDENFRSNALARVKLIMEEGSFIEGKYNDSFESRFCEMQNSKHTLLVANGTDALEMSLSASGVRTGDKVGVPSVTFYASAEAILNIGAVPVFVDVKKEDALMCPESAERMITKHNLKALMPVHLYGFPADMQALDQLRDKHNISIIEDGAQAHGAKTYTGPVGSGENLTTFSFYPTKNLSAMGDAGAILTSSDSMREKILHLRNHGRGDLEMLGRNSRCDHLQAAVLDLKLDEIEKLNEKRKEIASWYFDELRGGALRLVPENYIKTSSWHLFPTFLKDSTKREGLQKYLSDQSIGSAPFYDYTLSGMKVLSNFKGEDTNGKVLAGSTLCLPMHPFVTKDQVKKIADTCRAFFERA